MSPIAARFRDSGRRVAVWPVRRSGRLFRRLEQMDAIGSRRLLRRQADTLRRCADWRKVSALSASTQSNICGAQRARKFAGSPGAAMSRVSGVARLRQAGAVAGPRANLVGLHAVDRMFGPCWRTTSSYPSSPGALATVESGRALRVRDHAAGHAALERKPSARVPPWPPSSSCNTCRTTRVRWARKRPRTRPLRRRGAGPGHSSGSTTWKRRRIGSMSAR